MTDILVVTDLDGTLWDGDLRCHPSTFEALEELERLGAEVIAATGRRANSARAGFDAAGLVLPSVLLNGALGIDFRHELRFHEHAYTPDAAAAVLDAFTSAGLVPCVYTSDGFVQCGPDPSTSERHLASLRDDARWPDDLGDVAGTHTVLGMSILGSDHTRLVAAAEAIAALGHGELAFYEDSLYGSWSLMVQPTGISKWQGVQAWTRHRGIDPELIMAVGDGGNDLEMLDAADVSVAIEGSTAARITKTDHVIAKPEAGGWATLLDLIAGA